MMTLRTDEEALRDAEIELYSSALLSVTGIIALRTDEEALRDAEIGLYFSEEAERLEIN